MNHLTRQCSNCQITFTCDKRGRGLCESCRQTRRIRTNQKWRQRRSGFCPTCGKKLGTTISQHCVTCDQELRKGENSPQWKGGKVYTDDGYIKIYNGNRRSYIFEHRMVWERENRQKLPMGWIIHHLNGTRDDNRISNLVALPRKQHPSQTFIKLLQKRIKELEQLHLPLK